MQNAMIAVRLRLCPRHRLRNAGCYAATLVLPASLIAAQDFQISRTSVHGGAAMQSQNGVLRLYGTVGQPDTGVMVGESLEMTGGFWFGTDATDCNDDGLVNSSDYVDFVSCMIGPTTDSTVVCRCFDTDRNGHVDLADFATVQSAFGGG